MLDLFHEHGREVIEQQVGLIEEENELGLGRVAGLGQPLEQFGEHPQQQGAVEFGKLHQVLGGQDIDQPAALGVGLEEVIEVQGRLGKEAVGALGFKLQQGALDGADARGGDVAVLGGEGGGVLADILHMARRSLRSSSNSPFSSATRKTMLSTPAWISLSCSNRPSISGPISEMVARMGWPSLPKTSQNVTGRGPANSR